MSSDIRHFFQPKSIAVAGVSTDPDKLASIIFTNLRRNVEKGLLRAAVYAVNPAHASVGGLPCYPSVRALPEVPELVVVGVPVALTLPVVKEASEAGVRAAVIITSGFAEAGRGDLEDEVRKAAKSGGMRVLGPNTIGLLDTWSGVDLLFLRSTKPLPGGKEVVSLTPPRKGGVAVITQSGHLGEIISEELTASGVGVRALVGTGNQLDVSAEDMLGYFGDDPHTKVIALYLEGVRDGVRFMRLAAEAAKQKPVVVFKAGKTGAGARAALTHTASMAGDHQVYQAAFRRCGLVEVPDFQGLIDASVSLSMFPPMPGRRLVILTNAGGVGAIAADEAQSSGLDVKPLSGGARGRLAKEFRSSRFISIASLTNPVDLTASVSTDEFVKAAELILGLPECDALLVMPTHQTPAIDFDIAERLSQVISASGKPACACVMGRSDLATMIENDFLDRGIPAFRTPERAVRALSWAASYRKLRAGAAPPVPTRKSDAFPGLGGRAGPLDQKAVSGLLRAYGIGQPRQATVLSARDLPRAVALGFPVACKLVSRGLVHKKDAGGVALGIANRKDLASVFSKFRDRARGLGLPFEGMLVQEMVEGGVELIIGGTRDQTFGPVVAFGSGGTLAELTHDFGLEIAPLDPGRAKELIGATKAGKVVQGFRGGPAVDMESLCGVVSRFSRILTENPSLAEAEINPLIGRGASLYAVDARAVLGSRQTLKSGPPGRRAR